MNQVDVKGAMNAILSLLGKTQLPQESMYPYKIPDSEVWIVLIKKDRFYPDVLKEFNLVVKEHRWQLGDKTKEGYWDVR
jgi:hypothetical protein